MPNSTPVAPARPPVQTVNAPSAASGAIGGSFGRKGRRESIALPEIEIIPPPKLNFDQFEKVNESQVRYASLSTINPTGAVIPVSIAMSTRMALERLENRTGPIDDWICDRLQWSRDELFEYLTSEQIDGVALALDSLSRQEGIIIADQTGFGKGRILAAVARAVALDGGTVIFTTEKANLFSDFWRDIRDIKSEGVFGRPFMLNSGAKLVDTSTEDGEILVPAWKPAELKRVLESGEMPEGSRLMMATYSQFNKKGTKKSQFLDDISSSAKMILDEAHNFAGDSTTRQIVGSAMEKSSGSVFSSATFGRDVTNLLAYSSVFPWLKRIDGLEDMTASQRRSIAEESVKMATGYGSIIRREHDLSNMVLTLFEDDKRRERNEEFADKLSPILASMARLARKIDQILRERNEINEEVRSSNPSAEERKAMREVWFTANFGSRRNAIVNQFVVSLLVDPCIEQCVESLKKGIKPVVVIESTMESLMRELLREASDAEVEEEEAEDLAPTLPGLEGESQDDQPSASLGARPPTFRDALLTLCNRLLTVSVRRGVAFEKETIELDDPDLVRLQDHIRGMVEGFPELSLSPIDDIRDRIEEEGRKLFERGEIEKPWVADEISARGLRVKDGTYVTMPPQDRNQSVARYVNGGTQALVITRAASTGLSIHDSIKFKDHAQRHMIELKAPVNVIERIQTWGRVFRRGQRTEPLFTTLSTGLPFQAYSLAMQNRKVQELAASVTGSGSNGTTLDVPDPINAVGNSVAYDLLSERQALCEEMAISLNVEKDKADKEFYFVSKLFKSLPLLGRDNQRKVFESFMARYEDRLSTGTVLSNHSLEGQWKTVKREILDIGDGSNDVLNGGDVYVSTIETQREAKPLPGEEIQRLVGGAIKRLGPKPFDGHIRNIQEMSGSVLKAAMSSRSFRSVNHALNCDGNNPVKRTKEKLETMIHTLRTLAPGVAAMLPDEDGEPVRSLVVDIVAPPVERATVAREYRIKYLQVGDEELRTISLEGVVRDNTFTFQDVEAGIKMGREFNSAPRGMVAVQRKIIDGSGIGAVMAQRRMMSGSRASYLNEDGQHCTAILIPKSMQNRMSGVLGRTTLPEVVRDIVLSGGRIQSDAVHPDNGIRLLQNSRREIILSIPEGKRAAKPWENEEVLNLVSDFRPGVRCREAVVPRANFESLLGALKRVNENFYYQAGSRQLAVQRTRDMIAEREAQKDYGRELAL